MEMFYWYFELTDLIEAALVKIHFSALFPAESSFYIAVILPAMIWIGLAIWGAEKASAAKRSFVVTLFIGMAIPIVYPLIFPHLAKVRNKRRRRKERLAEEQEASRKQVEFRAHHRAIAVPNAMGAASAATEVLQPNTDEVRYVEYFNRLFDRQTEKISIKLHIEYADESVECERILEVLPKVVVVQTFDHSTGTHQSIRVPYEKITHVGEVISVR